MYVQFVHANGSHTCFNLKQALMIAFEKLDPSAKSIDKNTQIHCPSPSGTRVIIA